MNDAGHDLPQPHTALPAGEQAPAQGATSEHTLPAPFIDYMSRNWAPAAKGAVEPHVAREHFARRREALAARFPGRTVVIPTGGYKVRANDTDYRFRPGTDFFYLTGHHESDSVLVIEPAPDGRPQSTLYVEPRADRSTPAFFTDHRYGEFWAGRRLGVEETQAQLGITCRPLREFHDRLDELSGRAPLTIREHDAATDSSLPAAEDNRELAEHLSEMRLVKDDFEVRMLEEAVASTVRGFEDVVRALPDALESGERVIEGVFNLRARVEGNDVGYNTIAASGAHATVLHWSRNDGEVRNGDLLLLDAGVECNELYTADVTRTMPVSGRFTPEQRELYELVLRAQRAGIAAVRPGADFFAPHQAAMQVLEEGLIALGVIGETDGTAAEEKLERHRRYTLHGTSHMLGLDVHDCAHAREDQYRTGTLRPGYVLTVEPGLYFQPDDLTVPERWRGIGIRIEDDVLVTPGGCRVLSAGLPVEPDELEAWMHALLRR